MAKMTAFGSLSLIAGVASFLAAVIPDLPVSMPEGLTVEPEIAALASVALIIMGSVFIVGGSLLKAQRELLHHINTPHKDLESINQKLSSLTIEAKHSVQDFMPQDKIRNYRGHEIFQKNQYFYIRDVNAKFFTLRGAETWVDKTHSRRKETEYALEKP